MKKFILLLFVASITFSVNAQIITPQPSTSQKISQTIGLTDVILEYSRPSMRDRTIFGGLVPYDKTWRTGANASTKITFSEPVTIGGKELEAGTYAIYTKPSLETWEVYFYSDSGSHGVPSEWDEEKVSATVKSEVFKMPMSIETFTITFDDITNNTANMGMLWENVYVAVPISVNTDATVSKSIETVISGPSAGDYFKAAVYYLDNDKDISKAINWIDKAIEMSEKPAFWYYRQQSLIYAKSGDKKGAIKAAQTSLKLATEAGNDGYVALNKKSLKEWGAIK
ncbi:MAG: DUF2911 domain-containing protein [Flavobacteriaceae bacterium]|nr:DUF2911 domain-containing protein [Flavobacteriaceae bacterium]